MPNTFTLIASSTVGSGGAANIEFTSIPSTYTDLCVKFSIRTDDATAQGYFNVQLNSTDGSCRTLYGTGAVAGSDNQGSKVYGYANSANMTASTFANCELYVPNYTSSNAKSVSLDSVSETNATAAQLSLVAGLYSSVTSAVTSVKILAANSSLVNNKNFVQYSTAYLYGIVKS